MRGVVVPLSADERVQRALYLAGLADISTLDRWVRKEHAPKRCPTLYYRLKGFNGGKDPTAPDPADRWTFEGADGKRYIARTSDCMGAAAWIGGFDRYQPRRFAHIQDGWTNTDGMRLDAGGPSRCFRKIDAPERGCFVVYGSGSPGHKVGHVGTVIGVPAGFDRTKREHWQALEVVDVASRGTRPANQLTTGRGWFGADAWFVVSVMAA
jgi:hypothetical protein